MSLKRKLWLATILLITQFLFIGCSESTYDGESVLSNIDFEIIDVTVMEEGTAYNLKLVNNSEEVIVQNNVYISYPLITPNGGTKMNELKAEATGNKLNILSGEEVLLTVFISSDNYKGNEHLKIANPEIQFYGYINSVTEENKVEINTTYSNHEDS